MARPGSGRSMALRQQGEEPDSPQPEPGLSAPVLQPRGWPPLDSEAVDLKPGCMIAYRRSDPRASSQCRTQRYFRTFQATPLGHAGRGSRIWSLQAIEDVSHTSLRGHRLGIKTMCHRASPSIAAGPPPAHAGSRPTKRRSDWSRPQASSPWGHAIIWSDAGDIVDRLFIWIDAWRTIGVDVEPGGAADDCGDHFYTGAGTNGNRGGKFSDAPWLQRIDLCGRGCSHSWIHADAHREVMHSAVTERFVK